MGKDAEETAWLNPQAPSQRLPWENQRDRTPGLQLMATRGTPRRAWSAGLLLRSLRSNSASGGGREKDLVWAPHEPGAEGAGDCLFLDPGLCTKVPSVSTHVSSLKPPTSLVL